MPDPQQIIPAPVREYLVEFIAEQTGCTNPTDVRFVWTGVGQGVVTCTEPGVAKHALPVVGAEAEAVASIESGRVPFFEQKAQVDALLREINRGWES